MRTRSEFKESLRKYGELREDQMIELLFDIRDLLEELAERKREEER